VTAGQSYLLGFACAGLLGALLTWAIGPALRREVAAGVLLGLAVQAPLGWWTLRSIGTERFQLVWVLGMLVRLALLGIAALVLVPVTGWRMVPLVGGLLASILVLLLVEVLTALREHSGSK
jgi:apolipoprotein N-acyltransferase